MFSEDVAYWQGLQEQGEIESFEAVTLEPHGGELKNKFPALYGTHTA